MATSYKKDWSSKYPGCMIILLDQSGSMDAQFGPSKVGKGQKKCDVVANILNNFLNELISKNTVVDTSGVPSVRPRADIAVIGYEGNNVISALGGALKGKDFVTLSELEINPINIEVRMIKEADKAGKIVEVPVQVPVWVSAKAGTGTPMLAALQRARDLASQWAKSHPDNYPPVVVNVSDGMAGGDLVRAAQEIGQISTSDGQALVFNVHITELNKAQVAYPASEGELPNDRYAQLLFSMSSVIPESSRTLLEGQLGYPVQAKARGMIFNGDAVSVSMMFNFASAPATKQLDPNL